MRDELPVGFRSWRRGRRTEIWLLPASATARKRPSLDAWSAPWDPIPALYRTADDER